MGFICASGYSGDSAILFKYDSLGNVVWRTRYYDLQYQSYGGAIRIDNSNNIYIGGGKLTQNNVTRDFLIRKYSQGGSLLWSTTYNNSCNGADWFKDMAIDNNGNCYATGYSEMICNNNGTDVTIVKLNGIGQLQWARFYNAPTNNSFDEGHGIICDGPGNNIFVTGSAFYSSTDLDYITIKYDTTGDSLWVRTYNGPGNYQDNSMDIAIDNQSNVYITGASSTNGDNFDAATIKYTSSGGQEWVMRWGDSANGGDGGVRIAVDGYRNVFVAGNAGAPSPNFLDYLTIKYSQPVGINPPSGEIPDKFLIRQNYPNPFNSKTIINFQLPIFNYAKIVVYDVLGREVSILLNQKLQAGIYKVEFNSNGLSSGVYFYRLITDGNIMDTKKLIIMK